MQLSVRGAIMRACSECGSFSARCSSLHWPARRFRRRSPSTRAPRKWWSWSACTAELDDYLAHLAYRPGDHQIEIRNRFSFEGYLRAGSPWEDFAHEYLERAPLWELTLSWGRADKAAVVAQGYLWHNFDPLQLQLGRDVVHFGPLRSSLLPSGRLPFMDLLRLTMDFMISSLENVRALEEAGVDEDPAGLGHSFAAVSGLCVFAREDNAFVASDFFPVFSWHAGDVKPNNLSLIFDLEAVLFPQGLDRV